MQADMTARVESFTRGADLAEVARVLAQERDEILLRWLEVASSQTFHHGRRQRVVTDHIPLLLDALVAVLEQTAARWTDPGSPFSNPAVLKATDEYAAARFEQGLEPTDIVTEFRLLRQELGRALRRKLADTARLDDVLGAQLLLNDALDGGISLALSALMKQLADARDDLLATTVHDVQQPMTTIKGNLQLALRELDKPQPGVQRAVDTISRAVAEMDRTVVLMGTLTDASRLAFGALQPSPMRTDLVELLEAAVQRLDPETAARVRLDVPADVNAIGEWDPALLNRVISNLLSNAIKYSPPSTRVDLIVRDVGESVKVAVRDRGIGLASDEQQRIFRRYSRAAGAVQQGTRGIGLGLYVSRGIVEAHGGRISAESAGHGQGSTFQILLPRSIPNRELR